MRIASLLASATEMVYQLNLQDELVAISHECNYPPDALRRPRLSRPRFHPSGLSSGAIDAAVRENMARHGSVYQIDDGLLRQLQPDLILAQAVPGWPGRSRHATRKLPMPWDRSLPKKD
jgi:iron complex transport system substrate-binding protein